jgi:hypothetical protein
MEAHARAQSLRKRIGAERVFAAAGLSDLS